jgi:hypothetical protein
VDWIKTLKVSMDPAGNKAGVYVAPNTLAVNMIR